jgi:alpha/beta superfamily hydrolase
MEKHFIPVAHGKLEAIVSRSTQQKAIGIMCHPHPLYGGTMSNKVVTSIVKAWQALGLSTIQFNFRGVGESTGSFDHGDGEQADLQAVIHWAEEAFGKQAIYLGGFSFGAYVALKFCQRFTPAYLLLVAPPAQYEDFMSLQLPDCSSELIVAEQDEVVPTDQILAWASNQPFQRILNVPEASHFFHGKLIAIKEFLEEKN